MTFRQDQYHPITHMPIEDGVGSLPVKNQIEGHLATIEREQGKEAADNVRAQLAAAETPAETPAEPAEKTEEAANG
jgi:hypothetical protein